MGTESISQMGSGVSKCPETVSGEKILIYIMGVLGKVLKKGASGDSQRQKKPSRRVRKRRRSA